MNLSDLVLSGSAGVFLLLSLIQIAPVKLNPWSAIARKVRHAVYGPVEERLDRLEKKMDEREASSSRYRILRFNDEILQGTKHTREHFDQVLSDITVYEKFCRDNPDYPNNKAVMAIETIKNVYRHCVDTHDFL